MSKRNYDDTRDGAPEEDDARYASLHYRYGPGYSAMPPPPSSSSSSSLYPGPSPALGSYDHQAHLPPIRRLNNIKDNENENENDDNANLLGPPVAFAGYSVTPTPSIGDSHVSYGSLPALAPPPLSISTTVPHDRNNDNDDDDDGPGSALSPSQFSIPPPAALGPATDLLEVAPGVFRNRTHPWESAESCAYAIDEDMYHMLFQTVHGRQLNTLQPLYQLPVDDDEIKRQEYFHKAMYMIMGDKNHVGPIAEVLSAPSDRRRRVLDIGCGGGLWAMQISDEFPEAEVVGVDLAPIQPEYVPPNCEFELWDAQLSPYPNEYFDVIHCRNIAIGIRNYPLFLEEVARTLAPGGLVILVEPEIKALTEGKQAIEPGPRGGAPGWHAFWEQYKRCLAGSGIDTSVPTRLGALLRATGAFSDLHSQEACIPLGFWPKDAGLLTVAQYAWMDQDYFLPGVRPLFLNYGLSEFRVQILVEDAQQDLYYPLTKPFECVHVSHARKITTWDAPRRRGRRLA